MTTSILHQFLLLLVSFQFKHFLCDFPLQRRFMIESKTRSDWGFAGPLAMHCLVHGVFTLSIVLVVRPELWWLALVDFATHFTMDRLKSGPKYLGRFNNPKTQGYWNCFGIDQMAHHLNHYFICYTICFWG